MALDELVATIKTIKQRIKDHGTSLAANETRTRQVLIDPLLMALGWDISDPTEVALEYSTGHGRTDYALLSEAGPLAVIEAKRLNDDMDNHVMQALNYANSQGVKFMVTTNGDHWRMYDVFRQAQLSERVVMELRVAKDPAHVSAMASLRMWRTNLSAVRGIDEAKPPEDRSEASGQSTRSFVNRIPLTRERRHSEPSTRPVMGLHGINVSPERTGGGNWHRLDQLGDLRGRRGPIAVRDASGSLNRSHQATWADFYRKTVSWLLDEELLTVEMLPIVRRDSNRRMIADTSPLHRDGTPLKRNRFEYLGVFFDMDYTANQLVQNTLTLFATCGVAPSDVSIRFD